MNEIQTGRFYLTNSGIMMQSEAQTGHTLTFTRAGISEQIVKDLNELTSLVKLTEEKGSYPIRDLKVNDDGTSTVSVAISNGKLTEGYLMRTIGLYAKNSQGVESLYAVSHNAVGATFLPPAKISQEDILLNIVTVVGNAAKLEITINENNLYALKYELDNLAGAGRNKETVKKNADDIAENNLKILLLEAKGGLASGEGQISITFEDIDKETVLDGVWDKAGRKMVI